MGISIGNAPGGAIGRVTARERQIFKVGQTLEAGVGGEQGFSAPDRAVRPIACPIEGQADQTPVLQTIVCHAGDDMGVVMLYRNPVGIQRRAPDILSTKKVWIQIMRYDLRLDAENMGEMTDTLLERFVCFDFLQVADVVAEISGPIPGKAKGIVPFGANGQGWLDIERQFHRIGCIAPAATEMDNRRRARINAICSRVHERLSIVHPHHRIIAAHVDLTVVQKEGIDE